MTPNKLDSVVHCHRVSILGLLETLLRNKLCVSVLNGKPTVF